MKTPLELRALRAKHVHDAREILNKAESEGRDLTAEERQQFDRAHTAAADCKVQYERQEQQLELERELDQPQGRRIEPARPGASLGVNPNGPVTFKLRGQTYTFAPGTAAWERHQPAYREGIRSWIGGRAPNAALQTDSAILGGYTVMPEQFVAELLMNVDDMRWIRKLARKFATTATTLGAVKRTAKMASFAWGSELTAPTQDTSYQFGKRSLTPHYMTGEILCSRDLLRSSLLDVEEIVRYEIARDSGELEENAFLTGTGFNQPLGLFTASADGIDTSRDVSTGNTTTTIGADGLREAKYALKTQYRNHPSTGWIFPRAGIKNVSKLKDGEGQYLWQPSLVQGDPDRLLGYGVYESEFAPSTFTTGQYVGMLGAYYYYWICDGLDFGLQRLVEKYAELNQDAFLARRKVDGMPQIAEAFVRVKLA